MHSFKKNLNTHFFKHFTKVNLLKHVSLTTVTEGLLLLMVRVAIIPILVPYIMTLAGFDNAILKYALASALFILISLALTRVWAALSIP